MMCSHSRAQPFVCMPAQPQVQTREYKEAPTQLHKKHQKNIMPILMLACKRMKKCPSIRERDLWSHAPRLTPSCGDHLINTKKLRMCTCNTCAQAEQANMPRRTIAWRIGAYQRKTIGCSIGNQYFLAARIMQHN